MKYKYRIVQDGNGIYYVQAKPKGLAGLTYVWCARYTGKELKTLEEARIILDKFKLEEDKEHQSTIYKVIE